MHQRTTIVAGAAAGLATLLATSTAASAAEPATDIHATLAVVLFGPGELMPLEIFLVEDVVVGDGPELTAADLLPESDALCGDVEVDIDLTASTLAVTSGAVGCAISIASVSVLFANGPVVESAALLSDGFVTDPAAFAGVETDQVSVTPGWIDPDFLDEDSPGVLLGGTSTFSLTFGDSLIEDIVEPVPDIDDVITHVIEDAGLDLDEPAVDADVEAEAATPAVATPSFAG